MTSIQIRLDFLLRTFTIISAIRSFYAISTSHKLSSDKIVKQSFKAKNGIALVSYHRDPFQVLQDQVHQTSAANLISK